MAIFQLTKQTKSFCPFYKFYAKRNTANSQQFRLWFLSLHQNQVLDRRNVSLKCDYLFADESVRVDPSSSNLTLVMKRFLNVSFEAT